jgi:hypothetical protein
VGEGILLFQVLLLFSFNDAGAAQAPCPQLTWHPSLNILFLCGETQMMLLKEEASKTVIQTPAAPPQGMGKSRNVSHA